MTRDRIVVTPPTKEGAREILNLFRPRISPAEARLNIKFAEALGSPINPEWPEIAKEDQLTEVRSDPINPPKWGKAA